MNNNNKIKFFQETILKWFEKSNRKFSWRNEGLSNYQYVLAEVLLQRTKAETIAKFYPIFLKKFPSWKSIAKADIEEIEEYLKPIGLYRQRSKRLKSLAEEMVKRNGRLPHNREELEKIPFMGQYIANAVELIIFNRQIPLVDVNMARILERFFEPRKMADIRCDPALQSLSYKIVNLKKSKQINWAILDFAALICKARVPLCNICVLSERCRYFTQTVKEQVHLRDDQ